jgi:hypothetical protein
MVQTFAIVEIFESPASYFKFLSNVSTEIFPLFAFQIFYNSFRFSEGLCGKFEFYLRTSLIFIETSEASSPAIERNGKTLKIRTFRCMERRRRRGMKRSKVALSTIN